jgi:oxygen-independent coproporphyrinogen-3 oxidase
MCNFWLDIPALEARFGIDFGRDFAPEIERLHEPEKEGFVRIAPGHIEVLPLGRVFIRNICMIFDQYLDKGGGKPVFSRTI